MKKIKLLLSLACCAALISSCTKEPEQENTIRKGVPLNLTVDFPAKSKLAELTVGEISEYNKGFKNVGLYVYYTSDYNAGIVTKPYIRNLECKVVGNQLVPVNESSIYIYDKMTIVAFYPYNSAVGNFNTISDEERYPATMADYSLQTYIPYRALTIVDPTVAYKVNLNFIPKHTSKIEISIVGSSTTAPQLTNPAILPTIDPTNAAPGFSKREAYLDITNVFNNSGGGMSVTQYIAYIWSNDLGTGAGNDPVKNKIDVGDVLFQSDELTLLATQAIDFNEDQVYRFGYNMTTGEMFIPTSSNLVYDAASLGSPSGAYQVCDIDLSAIPNWAPVNLAGSFDGGGHQITGMKITSLSANGTAGLFGRVAGGSTIYNVNLVSPQINISAGTTTGYVGALCGMNNKTVVLTPADIASMRASLVASLPVGVASVVIDALLQDMILQTQNAGPATIVGCRVSGANITLSGRSLKAGIFCGQNGTTNASGIIQDCYATGAIAANVGAGIQNDTCKVASFVGYNNATIRRCYTTGSANAEAYTSGVAPVMINTAAGFCLQGSSFTQNSGAVSSCYATQSVSQPTVSLMPGSWPSWTTYAGKWPVMNLNTIPQWGSMGTSGTSTYPSLVWER